MTDTLDPVDAALDTREPTQDGPRIRLYLVDGSAYIFHIMLQKPDTAPIGRPSDLRVSGGRAW